MGNCIESTAPLHISSDLSVSEASKFLLQQMIEGVYVVDQTGEVMGILGRSQLLEVMSNGLPLSTPIANIMSTDKEIIDIVGQMHSKISESNEDSILKLKDNWNLTLSFFEILNRKKHEWETCLDSVYNPVVAVDNDERIVIFNKSLETVSGVAAHEAYGRHINEVFSMSGLGSILQSGEKQTLQKIKYNGKTLLSNRAPIIVNGQITGAVAVLQDISELELVVEELEITKKLNRQLDAIIESSYDGLYITDGEGNTLRLNQAFERIMGVTAPECVGRNMADLVADGVFTRSGTLLALQQKSTVTIPLQSKTGKSALVTSTPIFDEEGNTVLVVTNVRDLTDLIELERKLEDVQVLREKELEAILESSFDGLYITDGQGKTLRVNKGFERITGISAEECSGRYMNDLVKEGIYTRSGSLLAIEKREQVTVPLKAKSGNTVLVTSTPIYDNKDEIILVVTNVRDMTELMDLERKLEDVQFLRERELDAIFESSYDGLYITDGKGKTLSLNKGFERIMGVTAEECVGRNMAELVREGVFTRSGTLLALDKQRSVTISLQSKTGKTALVTSTPVFDDQGEIILVVTNVRDMTDLIELEQELERVEGLRQKELDAIFESSYDGLYITDGQGDTLNLNKGFERIMGVTAEECVGRNMADLVREGVYSRSGTLLALEKRETVTITLQSRTGKNALVTSTPIFDEEGTIVLVVTNVRDISELNELQGRLEHLEGLSRIYQAELNQLKLQSSRSCIIHSKKMKDLMKMVNHVAAVDSTVLILGESGVGKEVIADILHENSARNNHPFIKLNCGAIPHNLLESELFGYEPGAFSGASKTGKAGMFELATGGMLFLDEIAEMPLDLQVKLLRVLQDNKIMRIGGTKEIEVDVRIVAGTNRNLHDMVAEQKFRKDLFYRLNVVPINIPPLRDRREDIPVLSRHFLEACNNKYHLNKKLSNEVIKYFVSYDWPGNVRELENLIERLVVTTQHDVIGIDHLSSWSELSELLPDSNMELLPLNTVLENTERSLLQKAYSICGSTYEVARVLGISQPTVVRKAAKYGIKRH